MQGFDVLEDRNDFPPVRLVRPVRRVSRAVKVKVRGHISGWLDAMAGAALYDICRWLGSLATLAAVAHIAPALFAVVVRS